MQKKLIALFLTFSLLAATFAGAMAESGSESSGTGADAAPSSGSASAEDPAEYVPRIVRDHPDSYKKAPLSAFDKADGTVAVYETEDENLPDIDVYVFSKEGVNLRDYAAFHAGSCHSKAIQPRKDKDVYFFYDTEEHNGKIYYALDRMSEVDADRFGEITYYYKTKDIPLGNSGLVVSIPNGFKKVEPSDELKKFGYTDVYDYSEIVKDGTELSSALKGIAFGTEKLNDGQTFEDYLADALNNGYFAESTTFARHKFARLLIHDDSIGKNSAVVVYVCEKDGQINKLCLAYDGDSNGMDAKIMSTLGKAEK